ncbi:MAG: Beta-ketoacyl-acyl-carrier-protein synthase [Gammaproteobacteria bacterium]|jgi:3-oxoacyl-[acyl-carrier-protein] synthase-3|nr:Beta-ketoacyl-acyl-carrier-protein synthase [Gammaproteobacteria bacterium]
MNMYARLAGTGGYLPQKILTNHDLEKQLDTSDEWITTRTGIKQRHIISEDESIVSMAEIAAKEALKNAEVNAQDIGLIIVATCTPERAFPSSACLLQERLQIPACPAFDVMAACAGFSYALHIANQLIQAQQIRYALVIGSEAMSRLVDWQDRSTCILFGDGAGAVVLKADNTPGILASQISADGQYSKLLYTEKGNNQALYRGYIQMQGSEVFKIAVKTLSHLVEEALHLAGLRSDQLDWLVPHQANVRIIEATARHLKLSPEKIILTIAEHGNTSAASIPLALHQGICDKRIKPGQHLLLESFGAGFTWGSAVIRY